MKRDRVIKELGSNPATIALAIPRSTGRTTRMLRAAHEAAAKGDRAVVVVVPASQRPNMEARFKEVCGVSSFLASVRFTSPVDLDFENMRLYGDVAAVTALFVDASVIETHYEPLLRQLHRFDAVVCGEPIGKPDSNGDVFACSLDPGHSGDCLHVLDGEHKGLAVVPDARTTVKIVQTKGLAYDSVNGGIKAVMGSD